MSFLHLYWYVCARCARCWHAAKQGQIRFYQQRKLGGKSTFHWFSFLESEMANLKCTAPSLHVPVLSGIVFFFFLNSLSMNSSLLIITHEVPSFN